MAEGKIDNALEEVKNIMENKREDWVCHSQAIAATMSDRMEELGMTQRVLAEKMNCTQQYVSKVERSRKFVVGNLMQNRKCIRYQDIAS